MLLWGYNFNLGLYELGYFVCGFGVLSEVGFCLNRYNGDEDDGL